MPAAESNARHLVLLRRVSDDHVERLKTLAKLGLVANDTVAVDETTLAERTPAVRVLKPTRRAECRVARLGRVEATEAVARVGACD